MKRKENAQASTPKAKKAIYKVKSPRERAAAFVTKLSPQEINEPLQVFRQFFNDYELVHIRIVLQEWQTHLLEIHGTNSGKTKKLVTDMERLAEAAWLKNAEG